MAWDLGALAEYVRLPARFYAAACAASAILLFGPTQALHLIALDGFAKEQRTFIGLAFLVSSILVITEAGLRIYSRVKTRREATEAQEAGRKQREEARLREEQQAAESNEARLQRLARLTNDEKLMLQPFVVNNVRARRLPYNSGTRHALQGSGILGASSQAMDYDGTMGDYAIQSIIQPWALEELRKHPELIDLTPEHLGVDPKKKRAPRR